MRIGVRLILDEASWKTTVTSRILQQNEADRVVDTICASAIRELVSSKVIDDVGEKRKRAKANGITFHRSTNPRAVAQAGLVETDGAVAFRMVSVDEYKEYAHSFALPPE
jgi:hypothetical protein